METIGDGSGYGDGSGSGSGSGSGDGDGYGSGYGYGYRSGSGDGDGDGYGDGYGAGYGLVIGQIGKFAVTVFAPWPVVRAGCQAHTIAHWSARWREIAKTECIAVSEAEVTALLSAARAALAAAEAADAAPYEVES